MPGSVHAFPDCVRRMTGGATVDGTRPRNIDRVASALYAAAMADNYQPTELNLIADRYYRADDTTRKTDIYFIEYERIFAGKRDQPLRILELGVFSGASLLIWHEYLPNATIVGIDISEKPDSLNGHDRIHFIRGSQDDADVLDRAAATVGGPFDVIIDDASHVGYLTKRSFYHLFPRWLVSGGWYVIEDFGTGFMAEYPDGKAFQAPSTEDLAPSTQVFASHDHGMVGVVKQLADHMMQGLMTGTTSFLDIERMHIVPNVAFIQRGRTPAAEALASLPPLLSRHTDVMRLTNAVAETRDEVSRHNSRITELESVLGRLVERLRPLRAVRRLIPFR